MRSGIVWALKVASTLAKDSLFRFEFKQAEGATVDASEGDSREAFDLDNWGSATVVDAVCTT